MSKLAVIGGKAVGKIKMPEWPIFDQKEINAVTEVVKSGNWAFLGPKEKEFEEKFSQFCGAKYGITAANGTITLRIAMEALGIGPGDEVIVPGLTWQATPAAVLDVNAAPVLVDINPDTHTIDPGAVEAAVTIRTKCIIPVHLYGRMADMDAIMTIARKYKLFVIEDCAHQHGSKWRDKCAGTIGDIGSFSLQSSKQLNSGEGGFLTTNDGTLSDILQSLKNCGRPVREGAASMQSGNYRMTEFQSAIALVQLSRLEEQNRVRECNAQYIENQIKDMEGIKPLYRNPNVTRQAYHFLSLKYDSGAWGGVPKEKFIEAFSAEFEGVLRIACTYEPLNDSPLYQPRSKNTHKLSDEYWKAINPKRFDLPVCKKAYEESLLFYQTVLLTDREGCDNIITAFEKLRSNLDELIKFAKP